jgi:hypothetical protein
MDERLKIERAPLDRAEIPVAEGPPFDHATRTGMYDRDF